ncbi:MAG: hypothetical protein P8Y95_08330 [Gammaproteobacteria bacterium]|jgi:hypothetical protein
MSVAVVLRPASHASMFYFFALLFLLVHAAIVFVRVLLTRPQ